MKQRRINALLMTLLGIALVATSTACQKSGPGSSPTATMTAFFEAGKKKDPDGFKRTLSKGSLDLMESFAKAQNKTLDDALKSGMASPEAAEQSQTPAMRNEKITGDTATLEVHPVRQRGRPVEDCARQGAQGCARKILFAAGCQIELDGPPRKAQRDCRDLREARLASAARPAARGDERRAPVEARDSCPPE
jgi:hypothetical protein